MENLNLFIRSIFVDNMIFAYFLGMCSFLAVSKNVKTAFGLGIAVTFMLVVTLPINYLLNTYVLSAGALTWLGTGICRCRSELSLADNVHRRDCVDDAARGDGRGEILSGSLCVARHFPAAYSR